MKVTLWRHDAVFERPVAAATQRHDSRTRLFLRIEHDGWAGFGEVAPQPFALNGDPSVHEVIEELCAVSLPQLREVVDREGDVPSWTRIARFDAARPASSAAVALIEMALLDRELRATSREPRSLWPERYHTPIQSTVSLLDPDVPWLVADGAARVRAKTGPGAVSREALERVAALKLPVLLDFNCSATSDEEVMEQVDQLRAVAEVVAIEQPYAVGNVIDHATLAEQLSVPLSLDEGVRSLRDLGQIARYRAAGMVCIKPARVAGLANARAMAERAVELGLRPYFGGFFESPYVRRVHQMLANYCVSEPSDVGIVRVVHADVTTEVVAVNDGFGLAPSPELLEKSDVVATTR